MSILIYSSNHRQHGLDAVREASEYLDLFTTSLRDEFPEAGFISLTTCNRVEVVVDEAVELPSPLRQGGKDQHWSILEGEHAVQHIFQVAAGLDSMVVGEREIAGQLRRALTTAEDRGHASPALRQVLQAALKTSRRVAHETSLGSAGRTIATVALDLVETDWATARALIVGTGSYAGAVVADLRQRGAAHITLHSASGRGAAFAASHQIEEAPDLDRAIAESDVIITCRGAGEHIITTDNLASHGARHVIDLALERDVEPSVAHLPGVRLVTLSDVAKHAEPVISEDLHRAQAIVAEGLEAFRTAQAARSLDPAVVQLRSAVHGMVSEEIARLPQHRPLSADDAAAALRRLAGRILHVPSSRAREAAEAGRGHEFLDAIAALYGITISDLQETR